jgi:hypothetical protein
MTGGLHAEDDQSLRGEDVVFAPGRGSRGGRGDRHLQGRQAEGTARAGKARTTRAAELGLWKGRIWISEDFDEPLPDDLLDLFYEGHPDDPLRQKPKDDESSSG